MNILITGSCGFIGSHAVRRFLAEGHAVIGLDNLSRPGAPHNLSQLRRLEKFHFAWGDIRSRTDVGAVFERFGPFQVVLHAAAQVAVTTSVAAPELDFDTNAAGTLNMLEATRLRSPGAIFLFASTNKVYGETAQLKVTERDSRYDYESISGVTEEQPLDFHSPYGCSKGAADQYVHDYARIFGLRTVVLRQSCIYGPNQFGVEDQGWVAWFTIAGILGQSITIYGDGKQVRDLLWVDDLIDLYFRAIDRIEVARGKAYNVGGGRGNVLSIRELLRMLNDTHGCKIIPNFAAWRPGDQRVFISDCSLASADLNWVPTTSTVVGLRRLVSWVKDNAELIASQLQTKQPSEAVAATGKY